MSKNVEINLNPLGFREYDARWLYPKDINQEGIKNVGMGFGSQILSKIKRNYHLLKEKNCTIVIQVDGRKRGILEMPINSKEVTIIKKSKEIDNVSKYINNTSIIKNIYIKNKLVNFITKK